MNYKLCNANVYVNNTFIKTNIFIENDIVVGFGSFNFSNNHNIDTISCNDNTIANDSYFKTIILNDKYIFPGFVDVHVHLREPGFSYKETIKTGTQAAAHGGYTHICTMPNLKPVPDTLDNLNIQLDIIKNNAIINVIPYGSITKGENGLELSDFKELSPYIAGFSDDGRGVQNPSVMEKAMVEATKLDKIIAAHCEDESLLNGGYIHNGEYACVHNHKGISSESEWKAIERDLELVKKTGCNYHICHVSTKESVDLIRKAKLKGLNVTCETAPHYLIFNDMNLQESGNFKMNPPIRSKDDQLALLNGIIDGTIDMIATDHAPHSLEEKSRGLKQSPFGIVGLETAFPILYTNLVKTNTITLEKLITLLHTNPSKRFSIGNEIEVGKEANLTIFDLNTSYKIDPSKFLSMGKSSPFIGMDVFGECEMTIYKGSIVYKK